MVYKIFSRAVDRKTRKLLSYRTEFIDTEKNDLFGGNLWPISIQYEKFWNLNKHEPEVIVDKAVALKMKSKGGNWGIKILQ